MTDTDVACSFLYMHILNLRSGSFHVITLNSYCFRSKKAMFMQMTNEKYVKIYMIIFFRPELQMRKDTDLPFYFHYLDVLGVFHERFQFICFNSWLMRFKKVYVLTHIKVPTKNDVFTSKVLKVSSMPFSIVLFQTPV